VARATGQGKGALAGWRDCVAMARRACCGRVFDSSGHSPRGPLAGLLGRRAGRVAFAAAIGVAGCGTSPEPLGELPPPRAATPAISKTRPFAADGAIVVAHGGQGSPATLSDGPAAAVAAVWQDLEGGAELRAATAAGIRALEDDARFNAGTGANLRLDGRTIECDAAVMDDTGRFGAVAGLRATRHPIDAALAVADGPHLLVAGDGANALAAALELEQGDLATDRARAKLRRGWGRLLADGDARAWADFDWRAQWNFESAIPQTLEEVDASLAADSEDDAVATKDTVGIVTRGADGRYVAALSTGGTTLALRGRVGDVPQYGHGLFAGPHGAVAATGKGEAIVRERVAYEVYRRMAEGAPPDEAIRLATRDISADEGVGVIAVGDEGWGARASSQMAWATRTAAGITRADDLIRTDRW